MKPVVTFVLGALLASALALFFVKRDPAPATPVVETVATPQGAEQPLPAPITPETAPPTPEQQPPSVAISPNPSRSAAPKPRNDAKPASRRDQADRNPTFSSTASSGRTPPGTAPVPGAQQQTPAQTAQNTTSTSVNSQGGPPQTTISMPPAPSGEARTALEEKHAAPARVPKTVTIPAGTLLAVRVDERLSTDVSQTGDSFKASLDQPLVVDGAVIAERGARVEGRVAEADRGGKVRGTSTMALELVRLTTADGQRLRLQTESFSKAAERSTKKDAAKVGIGAGLGAAIGAIAGGGKGAAIGAGIGGAAGTGAVIATRGEAVEIVPETRLTFRLRDPITVTEKLR